MLLLRQRRRVVAADPQLGHLDQQVVVPRKKLVQRRVDQTNDDRLPAHRAQDADEILPLDRQQLIERPLTLRVALREDHPLHDRKPVFLEEHVLGPAQPDAFRAELEGPLRVPGIVRVRPHAEAPNLVRPPEQRLEIAVLAHVRVDRADRTAEHFAGRAVDRDRIARVHHLAVHAELPRVRIDADGLRAGDARLAPATRATTAAWLVAPPRAVRIPRATSIPCTSSGFVSGRTRITAFPCCAISTAASGSNTTRPVAAPGEALRPFVSSLPSRSAAALSSGSNRGSSSW